MEAVQLHATFGPNEESPDYAVQQCSFLAHREINRLMYHATETINSGEGDPLKRCAQAEQELLQARELTTGFGQDAQPVEAKLGWVRQWRAIVLKQPAPAPAVSPAGPGAQGPPPEGVAKLDMARRELSRGSTPTARKIAEEVCAGPYNLHEEAESLLRTIDAEEFAQQCRQDQKTFDAANSAFNRREYASAGRLLAAIDVRRLDPAREARWRELMREPGMVQTDKVQLASADGSGVGAHETAPAPQPTPGHSPDDPNAGHARATDDAGASLLKATEAMRQVKFQQLRKDGLDVQSKAQEKVGVGQTDAAIEMLEDYLASLDKEQIDAAAGDPAPRPGREATAEVQDPQNRRRPARVRNQQEPDDRPAPGGEAHRRGDQGKERGRGDEAVQRRLQVGPLRGGGDGRDGGPRAGPRQHHRRGRDEHRQDAEEPQGLQEPQGAASRHRPGGAQRHGQDAGRSIRTSR